MMKDNDKPTKCPCPKCKKKKVVRNWKDNTNSIAYDATLTPAKVMGNGWNDVINKVKKVAPRHMQDRLEQSRTFNAGRFVR